jgi:hypothetical protein
VNEPPTLAPPSSNGLDKHQGTLLEIFAFEDTASTPSHGNFDKAALAAAYQFEKFDHDTKKWVTVTPTNPELDTSSGRLTLTFPAASQYDFYRYRVDRYQIAEKDPVQGYIHRWSYDQKAGYGIYEETYPNGLSNPPVWVWRPGEWLPLNFITDKTGNDAVEIGTFTDGSKYSASAGGIAGAYYIDVTVPNSSSSTNEDADLIASTLTPANIQVFYDEGGFDPTDNAVRKVDLTGAVFEKLGPREFRIKLPSSFVRSNTASATLEVRLHDVQVNYTKDIPGTDDYPLNNVKIFGLNNTGTLNISSIANFS